MDKKERSISPWGKLQSFFQNDECGAGYNNANERKEDRKSDQCHDYIPKLIILMNCSLRIINSS